MPIYEYECADCGKHFDEIQKFSDEALTQCKFCGGPVEKTTRRARASVQGHRLVHNRLCRKEPEAGRQEQQGRR